MATMDRDRDTRDPRQIHVHTQHASVHGGNVRGSGGYGFSSGGGPTASQVIALVTLVPVTGTLLFLAGLTLLGTVIGLCLATPVFLLFSPVLVPAALLMGLAVTGFLSSGAFGLTGLSSLSRVVGYIRQAGRRMPDDLDYAKRRVADMAAFAGQKTKDVGQTIESKARESGTHTTSGGTTATTRA
ncbi:oleosin 18.2 kDa-like [Chenopodium quinoa]|uniref:oleosin 18.2 kDa-like n=1 Tax=Chenopodium quinoa TaxID=63459 RepID=UPI000B77B6BA|nr:oleosin 18.2 kDa-like [Chenopodium quinoa]